MSLLFPLGLLGLLSLPVIVALHLRRERSKQAVVSSLRLWDFLEEQLRGAKPRQIPFTWLLILDLLIAALLSFGLTQPHLDLPDLFPGGRHLVLLLDDSASMLAEDVSPSRFAQAKADMLELIDRSTSRDRVTVITFGGDPVELADSHRDGLPTVANAVQEIRGGKTGESISLALSMAFASLDEELPAEVHIFTDGAYPQPILSQPLESLQWHLYGGAVDNQAVLDLSIEQVGESRFQVFANVPNYSPQFVTREISLAVDGDLVSRSPVDLQPMTVTSQVWQVVGNPTLVTVALSGEDDLPLDDTAYLTVQPDKAIKVALVAQDPAPVDRALLAAGNVDLELIQPEDYFPGMRFDLTVFRGYLPESWPVGRVLVFDPPEDSGLLPVSGKGQIERLPEMQADELLAGISFSGVRWGSAWMIDPLPQEFVPLVQSGGLFLLLRGKIGLSEVVLFTPQLSDGNLTRHPAFPVLVANVVRSVAGFSLPENVSSGTAVVLPDPESYRQLTIKTPPDSKEMDLNGQASFYDTLVAGFYLMEQEDLDGGLDYFAFGVNAGSKQESNPARREWAATLPGPEDQATVSLSESTDLTPWLLGVAALLMVVEARQAWR